MNQRAIWADPAVRRVRQARAEAFMGRAMSIGPGPVVTANGGPAEVPGVRLALETADKLRRRTKVGRGSSSR